METLISIEIFLANALASVAALVAVMGVTLSVPVALIAGSCWYASKFLMGGRRSFWMVIVATVASALLGQVLGMAIFAILPFAQEKGLTASSIAIGGSWFGIVIGLVSGCWAAVQVRKQE